MLDVSRYRPVFQKRTFANSTDVDPVNNVTCGQSPQANSLNTMHVILAKIRTACACPVCALMNGRNQCRPLCSTHRPTHLPHRLAQSISMTARRKTGDWSAASCEEPLNSTSPGIRWFQSTSIKPWHLFVRPNS